MAAETNEAVLRRAAANFNDPNNRDKYFDLYASETVLHGYEGVEPGLANIQRYYRALWAAFPDLQW